MPARIGNNKMEEIEKIKKQKDAAYWERNQLIAALSKLFPANLAKHPEDDKEWEDDWRTIVVIALPFKATTLRRFSSDDIRKTYPDLVWHTKSKDGETEPLEYLQLTWHIHNTDRPMFDHLSYITPEDYWWDGHTTEEKYRRLRFLQQNYKQ